MKRILTICLAIVCSTIILTACSSEEATNKASEEKDNIKIVATIFPAYDWVREIINGNENAELTLLLNQGVDMHSFQPTVEDIVTISNADMFIYVGGESDGWVSDVLSEADNKDMIVINLMDILGSSAKEEELVEGMEAEEESEEEGEAAEEVEYDEHVWLSLKNAKSFCAEIASELEQMDSDNSGLYEANVAAYIDKLDELDKQYESMVADSSTRVLIFGDRFPFRYLVEDYGITYYAAFLGCSAESDASFDTIIFLANKVDELKANAIMQIETVDGTIAEAVKNNTKESNQEILVLNSMQSTTVADIEAGVNYYQYMADNLQVLKKALGAVENAAN